MLDIEVPRRWFRIFTLPVDFGRLETPDQYVIEDGRMRAEAICVVGWQVWSNLDDQSYVVGTVARQRVDGRVEELDLPSQSHTYMLGVPQRKLVSVTTYDKPYKIVVVRED